MKKITTAVLTGLVSATTLSASANNRLEETVVTSSRIEMPLREVAQSISIVTKEDIQLRGFTAIADTLRYEPSISVTTNGGVGKATQLRIRGEAGFRTRVYIDGIDVTDASAPQAGPNFANMLSGAINRVEILRGPEGLAYGADAGGVVNMYTARPESGFSGGIEAEGGRYGTQQYLGHIAGGSDTLDGAFSAEYFDTDGFNATTTDTDLRDDDGYENTTYHGRAGWNISESLRAEIVGRSVDGDNEFDDCFDSEPTNDCTSEYEQEAGRVAFSHNGEVFSNAVSYSENHTDRDFFSNGNTSFATEGELKIIDYLGSWKYADELTLVYGADFEDASLDDGSGNTSRDQEGYFLEYQGGFDDSIFITAGARYTDNDDFGNKTTYRASAVYLIALGDGELKFKGTYGTGFRAPSLSEIAYNENNPPTSSEPPFEELPPLPALKEEESEGYDLGVAYYANAGWYVDLIYFNQEIEDEIFFDLDDFTGYLQATGDTSSEGVELISEVPLWDNLRLSGNYTYTDTEDFDGDQRRRAPKHMANLGILYSPWDGRLQINLNYRVAHDVADESDGSVDDYEVLDVGVSYQLFESLQVYGRVENALDEDYEEIPTYRTPGAAGYAGLRYKF